MIEHINREIANAVTFYNDFKHTSFINESMSLANAKIQGMIAMLEIATEKEYYYDNDGLHEK